MVTNGWCRRYHSNWHFKKSVSVSGVRKYIQVFHHTSFTFCFCRLSYSSLCCLLLLVKFSVSLPLFSHWLRSCSVFRPMVLLELTKELAAEARAQPEDPDELELTDEHVEHIYRKLQPVLLHKSHTSGRDQLFAIATLADTWTVSREDRLEQYKDLGLEQAEGLLLSHLCCH